MKLTTANGTPVGPIGQGTWYLGENPRCESRECAAIRQGVAQGMNLIDTAEMYGEGAAEEMLGRAIAPLDRAGLFLVSKVYPFNAGRRAIAQSCRASLRRLGTDYLDLYLLHWRGRVPLAETVEGMETLRAQGLIRAWGVSNLDVADMEELWSVTDGPRCAANQVLYNLAGRGVEYDLLPWMQQRDIPMLAYCPLAQNGALRDGLLHSEAVLHVAEAHRATPQQILLAFLLTRPGVIPIPRTGRAQHAIENAAAARIVLTQDDLARLDAAFPPPRRKQPLEIV